MTFEVVRHGLINVSEEMGVALRRSAYSPNIRERMDHSCSVVDEGGRTIGQAEHIPVHIGSFPVGVRNTLLYLEREGVEVREGDMYVLNDPYIAGTHLNDITVVRPVHHEGRLVAYVANKAHHVDVGGMSPASISIQPSELVQEGLVIPPVKLAEKNQVRRDIVELIRSNSRTPETTLGDLRAQMAAAFLGDRRVKELIQRVGVGVFRESLDDILSETETLALTQYRKLRSGTFRGEDFLELEDRLLRIRASMRVSEHGVEVDFDGTERQVSLPLNAVFGVTASAVSYVVKAVACPDLPLNDGFSRTIHVTAPLGTMVNPVKPAPVGAGNVETSQRIADVVLMAFAEADPQLVPAASCGSMNNLMMGGILPETGQAWAFYETIGGGQGGRKGLDGVDGVHTNMTNTLNTSIEVMELYYPLRFVSYRFRDGSSGLGEWRGGMGLERSFTALAEMTVSVVGERSRTRPWGLMGGPPGESSEYLVRRRNGETLKLSSKNSVRLMTGDTLIIRTAGGGGWGDPTKRRPELVEQDLLDQRITKEQAARVNISWIGITRTNKHGGA